MTMSLRQRLVMLTACVVVGCGGHGGDGSRWIPETSTASLVAPSLEGLRGRLTTWLAGIEGASGVVDLIEARIGLDLRSREALEAIGVDPNSSFSIFVHEGAVGIALGVTHPERFHARISRQVSRLGPASAEALDGPSGIVGLARAGHDAEGWSLAWGTGEDGVGLVLWAPEGADADVLWRGLAGSPRGGGQRLQRAVAALDGETGAHLTIRGAPSIPSSWGLGPAKMLFSPIISGLAEWDGTWVLEPARTTWTINGRWTADGALAASWFQPTGDPVPLAELLPKSQTLTLRARLNPSKVLAIPSFIRGRFLPARLPGLIGTLLPPVEALLTLLNGDVAVSLLGLDARATVEDALGSKSLAGLLQFVHLGLVVGVTDAEAARVAIGVARERLQGAGWLPVDLEAGGWRGVTLRSKGGEAVWSILRRDKAVAILSGAGEVARFVQVAEGTALSLKAAADGEVARAAASSPDVALGLSASFRRITRELAAKGVPPFFLKMVNDLRAISGTVTAREDGVSMTLEVRL